MTVLFSRDLFTHWQTGLNITGWRNIEHVSSVDEIEEVLLSCGIQDQYKTTKTCVCGCGIGMIQYDKEQHVDLGYSEYDQGVCSHRKTCLQDRQERETAEKTSPLCV